MRIQKLPCILFIILWGLSFSFLTAQNIPYVYHTVKDGLVQQQVISLFEDSRGYLWVSTYGGVSRFNGSTFENFTLKDGLPFQMVYKIMEDSQHNIWMKCYGGWLVMFDGEKFQSYHIPVDNANIHSTYGIIDQNDYIWLMNKQGQSYIFDIKNKQEKKIPQLEGLRIRMIIQNKDRQLITNLTEDTLYQYKDNELKILKTCTDCDFRLFSRKNRQRLISINKTNKAITHYHITGEDIMLKPKDMLRKEVPSERYYPISEEQFIKKNSANEVFLIDENNHSFKLFDISPGMLSVVPSKKYPNIIWIGTEQGLYQVFLNGFRQLKHPSLEYVWGIQEDEKGDMFLANFGGDLIRYDGKDFKPWTDKLGNKLRQSFYMHPSKDEQSTLYFATKNNIRVIKDGMTTTIPSPLVKKPSLFTYYDEIDKIVVAAGYGGFFTIKDKEILDTVYFDAGKHSESFMTALVRDRDDNYWVSSFLGLTKYHIPSKTMTNYSSEENTLNWTGVECMTVDNSGTIWMGGPHGLGIWDMKGDSIQQIAPAVFDFRVDNLLPIDDKWLAIGSSQGMFFLDLLSWYQSKEIRIKSYTNQSGYMGLEPGQNMSFLDSQRRLWVASSTDVSYLPVDSIVLEKPLEGLRINKLNDKGIPFNMERQSLSLPYGKNDVVIHFESIGKAGLQQTKYAWKLEKQHWWGSNDSYAYSDWTTQQSVAYSNLSAGTYLFKVKSRTPEQVDHTDLPADELLIKIAIPLWKSPHFGFWLSLFLLLAGIAIAFLIWKNRVREKYNKTLTTKNHEILRLNQEIAHRSKNHLQLATSLVDSQRRKLTNKAAKSALQDSENRLRALTLVSQQLSVNKGNNEIDLKKYLGEIIDNLHYSYEPILKNSLTTSFECINIQVHADKALLLGLILNELFTNSVKHAFKEHPNPKVDIHFTFLDAEKLQMDYVDNGIKHERNEQIFSGGQGLKLVQSLTRQLDGHHQIEIQEGFSFKAVFSGFVSPLT